MRKHRAAKNVGKHRAALHSLLFGMCVLAIIVLLKDHCLECVGKHRAAEGSLLFAVCVGNHRAAEGSLFGVRGQASYC